ncbi:transporter substrate-binding domain-containing protein [Rothia sp. CCM 9418]|uniref:ABC transporter substrate-binding protein n=1 Tax=Rothia sp. CCM 9418 TaxID=3402661 RepID=UPI003AE14AAE
MKKTLSTTVTILALSALTLTGCQSTDSTTAEGDPKLVTSGELTVCTNSPYKPFEFEQDGKIVGYDMDIAQAIADKLKLKLNISNTGFEGLDSGVALSSGQCDIAISGITKTEERATKMSFTEPYLNDNLGILVPKDSTIANADNLKDQKVAVQQATSGEKYATEHHADTVQYEDAALMIQALQTGQAQAVIANISVISQALTSDDSLKLAEEINTHEEIAAAVATDNQKLLDEANNVITTLKEDGELAKLQEKWLGVSTQK